MVLLVSYWGSLLDDMIAQENTVRLACAYYASMILRIIGHQFSENNSGIIGHLLV